MQFFLIVAYVSILSPLVPLIIALLRYKTLKPDQWWLISLLSVSLLADGLLWYYFGSGINTWPIVNVYYILQFILLYIIFTNAARNGMINLFFIVFLSFAIINFATLQTPLVFNSRTSYIGALLVIGMALYYLYQLFQEMPMANILNMPMLWVSFGVLFYFAGTLFLFLFNNYLILNQPQNHQLIWVLHNVLNIIKNLLFAVALWKYYRRSMLWK